MLWLILGILLGAGLTWLVYGIRNGKIEVKWYQIILGVIALAMLLLTIENYIGFKEEMEPQAANFLLWAMGLPGAILGLLAIAIPKMFKRAKSDKVKVTTT